MLEKRIITAEALSMKAYLARVWEYRRLITTFALRDLKVKYAQTLLGISWALIQPLTAIAIFTMFFGVIIKIDVGPMPYPLFALTGVITWTLFQHIIYKAGSALHESQNLISKVYFPKILLPFSKTLTGLFDFLFALVITFVFAYFYYWRPSEKLLLLPFFVLVTIITGNAVSLWLSGISIRYRDFQHFIPFLANFGIWLTPVFYPLTLLPEKVKFIILLNPMTLAVEGLRWSIFDYPPPEPLAYISLIPTVIIFITAVFYYKNIENKVTEII